MANQVQESILNAIQHMVDSNVNRLAVDKTVTATIVKCTNAITSEYRVNYNGGYMLAYAQNGAVYKENTEVYIHVPLGDFTQTKMIVGKAQKITEDSNISFVNSLLNNYNLIGKNPIGGNPSIGLHSYLKEDYQLIYQYGEPENSLVTIDSAALRNTIQSAEVVLMEASFATRLPKEHRMAAKGSYGVVFTLAFKDRDETQEDGTAAIKYLSYQIDSNSMTGNPFLFNSWSDQQNIFSIDTENFLYIDSILAYSKDFVSKDDHINADLHGADILIKEIEFYGLKEISATNGEYKLTLAMPQGNTLFDTGMNSSVSAVAQLQYKESNNLSDSATFYWFAEDSRITSASENYHMYGGVGWRLLSDKDNNYTATFGGYENKAYVNNYMCVVVYKENIILKDTFIIYNEACRRDITITSSLGEVFSFDRGKPKLTCLVNGYESQFERDSVEEFPHPDSLYRFVWSKTDAKGNTTIFNQTERDIQKSIDELIKGGDFSYSTLSALKSIQQDLIGVEFVPGKNTLIYPVKKVDNINIFTCEVFLRDSIADTQEEEYSIGSASIILQNENAASPLDYSIVIENGNQVFQYSVDGVAPNSTRNLDPITILPLQCRFYDPSGNEVNRHTYSVKWIIPLESTMIKRPVEGLEKNPANEKEEWLPTEIYNLEIAENYNYSATNNQIGVIVTYNKQQYTSQTNLTFTKVGENGTNGTDIVAKINPAVELPDNETLILEVDNGVDEDSIPYEEATWNYGTGEFNFLLFQQNLPMSFTETPYWGLTVKGISDNGDSDTISVNQSKYLQAQRLEGTNVGQVYYEPEDAAKRTFRAQIVKSYIKLGTSQQYYAFYPIPMVYYHNANRGRKFDIKIHADKTLKTVLYNSDGRNPLYNTNQGLSFEFVSNGELNFRPYITYTAEGGLVVDKKDNPAFPAFSLSWGQNPKKDNAATYLEPTTNVTEEEIQNDVKAVEILQETYNYLLDLLETTKPITDGFDVLISRVQSYLDAKLKPYNRQVKLPEFVLVKRTGAPFAIRTLNQIQAYQNQISAIWADANKTLEQKQQEVSVIIKEVRKGVNILDEIEADYYLELSETYEELAKQIYDSPNKQQIYDVNTQIYILPDDVYEGLYTNNVVHAKIYDSPNGTLLAEIYLPIHMSLNTYGLQSLNAWDGNHIEINEDDNYILAPQIGAGEKNEKNQFTGVLMGKATTYDALDKEGNIESTSEIGLLGYHEGQQSIFLDANTGNATFGLPSAGNGLYNGRIELVPGGTSRIGTWHLATNSLYSGTKPNGVVIKENELLEPGYRKQSSGSYELSIPHDSYGIMLTARPTPYITVKGKQMPTIITTGGVDYTLGNVAIQPNDTFEVQLDPQESSIFTLYRHTPAPLLYKHVKFLATSNGNTVIVYNSLAAGTSETYSIFNGSKWQIKKIMLDSNISSVNNSKTNLYADPAGQAKGHFVIAQKYTKSSTKEAYYELRQYKFTKGPINPNLTYTLNELISKFNAELVWRREDKVGIDNQGRFYTNTLKDANTSMQIGQVGAFGLDSKMNAYIGASFEVGNNKTLIKMFMDMDKVDSQTAPIYMMGASSVNNSYERPLRIYGSSVTLLADPANTDSRKNNVDSPTRLEVTGGSTPHTYLYTNVDNYLKLNTNSAVSELKGNAGLKLIGYKGQGYINILQNGTNSQIAISGGSITQNTTNGSITMSANSGNIVETATGNISLTSNNSTDTIIMNASKTEIKHGKSYLTLQDDGTATDLYADGNLNITGNGSNGVIITSKQGRLNLELTSISGKHKCSLRMDQNKWDLANTVGTLRTQIGLLHPSSKKNVGLLNWTQNMLVNKGLSAKAIYYTSKAKSPSYVYNNSGHETTYTSDSLWNHFEKLYSLVSKAYSRANSAYELAQSIDNKGDTLKKSLNKLSKEVSSLREKYNKHTHNYARAGGWSTGGGKARGYISLFKDKWMGNSIRREWNYGLFYQDDRYTSKPSSHAPEI